MLLLSGQKNGYFPSESSCHNSVQHLHLIDENCDCEADIQVVYVKKDIFQWVKHFETRAREMFTQEKEKAR